MLRPLVLATLVLVAVPASAQAARYEAGAYGNSATGIVEKTSFPIGASYALRFTDTQQAGTRYRLCAFFQGRKRKCVSGRTGAAGTPSEKYNVQIYGPQTGGTLTWRYYVNSRRVAAVTLKIRNTG